MSRVILEVDGKPVARAVRKGCRGLSRNQLLWFYGATALISFVVFVVFWCTNIFQDRILSMLVLRNGTASFYFWQRPPIALINKIYVFNYTNVKEFEAGTAEKLNVQELGPYIYKETLSRVNVEIHENGTVSYQEKRSFEWVSGRPDDEVVVVPSIPLIGAIAYSRDIHFFAQVGMTMFLAGLRAKPFIEVPVNGYLWGYDDSIFKMGKSLQLFQRKIPFEKFGILAFKNGLSMDRITMHTGDNDLRNLGIIQSINGLEDRHIWGDRSCDRVYGTDGSMFPPDWIQDTNSTLYVYAKDICRNIPFRYEGRSYSRGIPTLRYKMPRDVFTSTPSKDSCYCTIKSDEMSCPPAGILNISGCNFQTPVLLSFPHFYMGDPSIYSHLEGLNPREELHESYVDIHPRLAVPVDGQSRLQLNIQIRRSTGVPIADRFTDGMILPLIWVDLGSDTVPEEIETELRRAHYTANAMEAGFQWCSLIALLIFFGAFVNASRRQARDGRPLQEKQPPE